MNRGNEEIARAFDNPARSNMVLKLAMMEKMRLLEDGELGSFTKETREKVEVLARGQR